MQKLRQPTPAVLAFCGLLGLIALRLCFPDAVRQEFERAELSVSIARVLDGDTFDCADGRRVRLLGVDAPELSHGDTVAETWAEHSAAWLRQRIEGQAVRLQLEDRVHDKYGRTLAWVFDQQQHLINQEMLSAGAARLLPDFGLPPDLEPQLRAAEADARVARRGLWGAR